MSDSNIVSETRCIFCNKRVDGNHPCISCYAHPKNLWIYNKSSKPFEQDEY